MKPDWDTLMQEYADSKTAVIGDVDCTVHQSLCQTYGVQGYPTIKWGSSVDAMEAYEGGRDLNALRSFAADNLGPSCGPANLDLCSAEQAAEVKAIMALDPAAVAKEIEETDAAIKDAEDTFTSEVEKLQKAYQGLMADKDSKLKELRSPKLKILKQVNAHNKAK